MVKWITLPGLVNYQEGIKIMEDQLVRVINSTEPDTIFLLEHKEVYTAGTSHNIEELLKPDLFPVIYTGRGGKFTYHGIAVNISTNLNNYSGIIPCGINDFPITSLEEMGINISMTEFDIILKKKFIEIF